MTESDGKAKYKSINHPHAQLTSRLFVNAPFDRLQDDLLPLFIENRIQPEIGLEGACLYNNSEKDFESIANSLVEAGLICTLHAPFGDLAPGASDPRILEATRNKLLRAFDLVEIFKPVSIVCHPGFEDNKHSSKREEWLANSLETWQDLLSIAENQQVPMMLENTYETRADELASVLAELNSPYARFCLDTGHVMAFAGNTWQDWLTPLEPWLGQLHLHDNHGGSDQHLAIGNGIFDFAGLFSHLHSKNLKPVITLEPHREEDLWTGLDALGKLDLPEPPHLTSI